MPNMKYPKNPADKLIGHYSNYFQIGHNAFEFVFDFGQYYEDAKQAEICLRIVTGPIFAKQFLKLLEQAVDQFEDSFGALMDVEEGEH
jgi:hypothetical protein